MGKKRNIEIRSDEVNDILRRPPSWIVRWGITMIISIIIVLIAGSMIFKYPDRIVAPIIISSENMPVRVLAKSSGRLTSFLIKDHESVKKEQLIAVVENTTNLEDFFKISSLCDSIANLLVMGSESEISLPLLSNTNLGELQAEYTSLYSSISEYSAFIRNNFHRRKSQKIRSQIGYQHLQISASSRQLGISKERTSLSGKIWERDSTLYFQKVISTSEMENSKRYWLESVQQYEAQNTDLNNLKISLEQAEQSIFDLEEERSKSIRDFHRTIKTKLENIKASMASWEKTYLLKSPIEGRISLSRFWEENQNIHLGDVIATVIPAGETKIIGKIFIPIHGAGKVKLGQKVNVKIDNYPFLEYGMVTNFVSGISEVPAIIDNKNVYVVTVYFPRKMITGYKVEIPYNEEMTGVAEIITNDVSVLKRIIYPLRHLLEKFIRS